MNNYDPSTEYIDPDLEYGGYEAQSFEERFEPIVYAVHTNPYQRIQEMVQAHYDFLGDVPGTQETQETFTSETISSLAQIIAQENDDIFPPQSYIDAAAIIDSVSEDDMARAVNDYSQETFGKPEVDLDQDQQAEWGKLLYGREAVDPKVKIGQEPRVFTESNARTLVREITMDIVDEAGITEGVLIQNLEDIVASSLYSDWRIDSTGSILQGAAPDLTTDDFPSMSPILRDVISEKLERSSRELKVDPTHLLRAWKLEEVLDIMEDEKVITAGQKRYLKYPTMPITDEDIDEFGAIENIDEDAIAMLDNINRFIGSNYGAALRDIADIGGVDTIAEAYRRMIVDDKKLSVEDRQIAPYGFDPVVQRKRDAADRMLSAFGSEGKSFNNRIDDLMKSMGITVDTSGILDKNIKKATEDANSRMRDALGNARLNAELEGLDEMQIFEEVAAIAGSIYDSGEYGQAYQDILTAVKQVDLQSDSGQRAFAKNIYANMEGYSWYELTEEQQRAVTDRLSGMSVEEAEQDIIGRAKQLSDEVARMGPGTLAEKNALLSSIYQSSEFRERFGAELGVVEFKDLSPELQAAARSEISGMSDDEALEYALEYAGEWVAESNEQKAFEEAQEAAAQMVPASRTEAVSLARDLYIGEGYDIGEIPNEIISKAGGEIFRSPEGLSLELQGKLISDLDTQLPELAERVAFEGASTPSGLQDFAFNLALDERVISNESDPEFVRHFEQYTIPTLARAAARSGAETTDDLREFFLNELQLGGPPTLPEAERETFSGVMSADVSEEDYLVQHGVGIPMFPTGGDIPEFGQIPAADLRAGMDRARQERIESEASLDIAGARTELERLQAARAAEGIEIPEISGYDERGWPVFEGLEIGSKEDKFIRGLMDRSRRDRMRQEEDRAYRRSIQQQVPVGAGEFAGAIQQAAGDDLGFQRYLLGQSEAVRQRFKKTGGRTAARPRDFSEYFVGEELDELRSQYTQSPAGIASELGRMETERVEAQREEEDIRRRELRPGRTIRRI